MPSPKNDQGFLHRAEPICLDRGNGEPAVSLVIPAYNEQESIPDLYTAVREGLDPLGIAYEVIFIDDGSEDGTAEAIASLADQEDGPDLEFIRLRRNFGKSVALSSGFDRARGEVVVTLDADLQDDPSEIPRLIEKLQGGWDLVSGWKADRRDPLEKRLASKIFNGIVSMVGGFDLHDVNCGLKAYRRCVVKKLHIYGGHHRFIPLIAASYGFKICEIAVKHHPRKYGQSKYGVMRYIAGWLDLFSILFLVLYRRRPMYFVSKVSTLPALLGMSLIIYTAVMKFGFGQTGERPSLTAGVFLVGLAAQIFFFGLLADLLYHLNASRGFDPTDFESERSQLRSSQTHDTHDEEREGEQT